MYGHSQVMYACYVWGRTLRRTAYSTLDGRSASAGGVMYACYVYNATRYGALGHWLLHTLGRTAEPGLSR